MGPNVGESVVALAVGYSLLGWSAVFGGPRISSIGVWSKNGFHWRWPDLFLFFWRWRHWHHTHSLPLVEQIVVGHGGEACAWKGARSNMRRELIQDNCTPIVRLGRVICIQLDHVCSDTVGTVGAPSVAVVLTSEEFSSHLVNATFKSVHRSYTEPPYRQSYTATMSYYHEQYTFPIPRRASRPASWGLGLSPIYTRSRLRATAAAKRHDAFFARALT